MSGARDTSGPEPASATQVETANFMGLVGAGWKQFQQMDSISKAIIERLQAERRAEIELAAELLKCRTPTEAFALYTKWVRERTTALLDDGTKFAHLWAQFYVQAQSSSAPTPQE